jgi:hypothetical protein
MTGAMSGKGLIRICIELAGVRVTLDGGCWICPTDQQLQAVEPLSQCGLSPRKSEIPGVEVGRTGNHRDAH